MKLGRPYVRLISSCSECGAKKGQKCYKRGGFIRVSCHAERWIDVRSKMNAEGVDSK